MAIALNVHVFYDFNVNVPCQVSGWRGVVVNGLNVCEPPLRRRSWVHSAVAFPVV